MSKLRILFVGHSPHLHGAEYSLLRLLQGLDDRFETTVLAPSGGSFEERVRQLGKAFYPLQSHHPFRLKKDQKSVLPHFYTGLWQQHQRLLNTLPDFDLVHSNTLYVWDGALLAAARGVPHVWNPREIPESSPTWDNALGWPLCYNWIQTLSDHLICVSHALRNTLPEGLDKISSVVHNGLDPQNLMDRPQAKKWLSETFGIAPDQKVALTVGNFIPEKGHRRLLDSLANTLRENPHWHFLWVGEKHFCYPEIQKILESDEYLMSRVHCTGPISKMGEKFSCADLYLCPSHTEAFPTVLLESRLAKVPFITTDCGGAREIAEKGGGWCCERWEDFVQRAQLSMSQSTLSVPDLEEGFDMKQMVRQYGEIYLDIARRGPPPSTMLLARQQLLEQMFTQAEDLRWAKQRMDCCDWLCGIRGLGRWFRKTRETFAPEYPKP